LLGVLQTVTFDDATAGMETQEPHHLNQDSIFLAHLANLLQHKSEITARPEQ